MYSVQILDRLTNRAVVGADVSLVGPDGMPMGNMRTAESGIVGTERQVPHGSYWEVRTSYFGAKKGGVVEGRSTIYLDRGNDLIPDGALGDDAEGQYAEVPAASAGGPAQAPQNPNSSPQAAAGAPGFLGIPFPLLLLGGAAAIFFVNKHENEARDAAMGETEDPYQPIDVKDDIFED